VILGGLDSEKGQKGQKGYMGSCELIVASQQASQLFATQRFIPSSWHVVQRLRLEIDGWGTPRTCQLRIRAKASLKSSSERVIDMSGNLYRLIAVRDWPCWRTMKAGGRKSGGRLCRFQE